MNYKSRSLWLFSNATLIVWLLLATIFDLPVMRYIGIGFLWLILFAYLSTYFDKDLRKKFSGAVKPAPNWACWSIDIAIAGILIAAQWYWATACYVASCVVENLIYGSAANGVRTNS